MHLLTALACFLLFGLAASTHALSQELPSSGIPAPLPSLGSIAHNGILHFEDVKKLSLPMSNAVEALRSHKYQAARSAFQRVQKAHPQEALAYRGEIEASQRLNTLSATVSRYRKLLAETERANPQRHGADIHLAVLHWALGEAIMMERNFYPKFIADSPSVLGSEPYKQFEQALELDPDLLVAHLSLAAYYEHDSQQKGSLARHEYEEALRLRPDLYQIRYLHAYSWDRPGVIVNEAQLLQRGIHLPEDKKKMPEKAISEYLALIRDHPAYAPPYYCLADDYWFMDKAKAKFYYEKYLELGNQQSTAWKRAKSIVDALNQQSG